MRDLNTLRPDSGGRSTVFGTKGAVACEHPQATLTGIKVLDAGGTAADACVAMAAAMTVLSPMSTGMGGDAFLLFYEAETGRVLGADGSGRAPMGATIEKLRDRGITGMPERGGLTVTVPGAVRLWGGRGELSLPSAARRSPGTGAHVRRERLPCLGGRRPLLGESGEAAEP